MNPFLLMLLLCNCFFSGLLYADDNSSWQLKKTEKNIPVYTRKVEGSPILEFKSHAIINTPMEKAIALFEDEKKIALWYFECTSSKLLEHENANNSVIYLVMRPPWPVAPRDFIFRRTRTDHPDGTVSFSLTALPDRLPQVKGMIRVNSIQSVWTFKPLSKDKTELFFQQHTEPGGSIPPSLINKIETQTPVNSLESFRKILTGKEEEDTHGQEKAKPGLNGKK
jgi:hypothetical protein